jgi:hypothetical protein
MFAVLIFGALLVLAALAAFVWTAVRSAVRQAVENARRADVTAAPVAHWTRVTAAPVYHASPVDPREPVYGSAADSLRDDLRRRCY